MKTLLLRLAVLAALIASFTVGMSYLLTTFKVENTHRELRHARFDLAARDVDHVIEQSLALGMSFGDMTSLAAVLERRKTADSVIESIVIANRDGVIAYSTAAAAATTAPAGSSLRVGEPMPAAWRSAIQIERNRQTKRGAQYTWRVRGDETSVAGTAVINSFGIEEGYVAISYSGSGSNLIQTQMRDNLRPVAITMLPATAVAIFAIMALVAYLFSRATKRSAVAFSEVTPLPANSWLPFLGALDQRIRHASTALAAWREGQGQDSAAAASTNSANPAPHRRPFAVLTALGMIGILAAMAVAMTQISSVALTQAEQALTYETMRKAESVGRAVGASLDQAAELGIPLDRMPGVEERLRETRAQYPELAQIAVMVSGEPLYAARAPGNVTINPALVEQIPIKLANGSTELMEVAVDPSFIARLFRELVYDFAVILVVAIFITLELIYFLLGPLAVTPLRTLSTAIAALGQEKIAGAVPAYFPGTLHALALAVRSRQDALLAEYRAAHASLRERLARYRAQRCTNQAAADGAQEATRESLVADVGRLAAIRKAFGLRRHAVRAALQDPNGALGRMRAPFFLLLLAEDLSRSFLPLYAGTMNVLDVEISPNLVVGLPIFLFMFIVAVSQPTLGGWSERVGRRRAFLCGAAIAVVSHLLAAQAGTLWGLLIWRAAAGAAWAIAFVAAQGIVLDHTDKTTRAKGLAGFVTVIMVSLACGPSVGGLLADGLGYRTTFVIAAGLAFLSFVIAWRDLPRASSFSAAPFSALPGAGMAASVRHPLRNWRFVGLLVLAAVPAKLILVAFCYYLIPLFITSTGNSSALAGRIIMIYSLVMVLLVPLAADAIDRIRRKRGAAPHAWLVGVGIAVSGLSGAAMLLPDPVIAAALLVILLGAAQALSISPQAAMVPELARAEIAVYGEATVYGYYRLVERIGSALGPLVAAAMLHWLGYRESFVWVGVAVFAAGIFFLLAYALKRSPAAPHLSAALPKVQTT